MASDKPNRRRGKLAVYKSLSYTVLDADAVEVLPGDPPDWDELIAAAREIQQWRLQKAWGEDQHDARVWDRLREALGEVKDGT